jgi:hypothetical protein
MSCSVGGLLGVPLQAALIRLSSRILATAPSVVPNASAKPALSADEGWLIVSGWFGFDFTIKRGAPGRLSRRLRYRSITARCCGVGVASAPSAEPRASLRLRASVFRLIGSVIRKVPYRATRLGYVAEQNGWMARLSI